MHVWNNFLTKILPQSLFYDNGDTFCTSLVAAYLVVIIRLPSSCLDHICDEQCRDAIFLKVSEQHISYSNLPVTIKCALNCLLWIKD